MIRLIPKGSIFNAPVALKGKARPVVGQITVFCNICGRLKSETRTKRLVRDHDHKTGFIRGILCDDCNHHIGTYESEKYDYIVNSVMSETKKKIYLRWENEYKLRIKFHLACNTGIRYTHKIFIPLESLIH